MERWLYLSVLQRKASIGVFVCFKNELTRNMEIIVKQEGYFKEDLFGQNYPKIQIITVEDLFDDKNIYIPTPMKSAFKNGIIK